MATIIVSPCACTEEQSSSQFEFFVFYFTEPFCNDGDILLAGGDAPNEGRVEVCKDGWYRTVCDNTWDNSDAAVVCRQLGYMGNGNMNMY